jgi:hypothetical protein
MSIVLLVLIGIGIPIWFGFMFWAILNLVNEEME